VAEELGDDDEVGAAAYERRRERVAQDVDGRVVVEAGGRGDGGDDVVRAADAEALAALVEKQRGASFGAGAVGAFIQPAREGGAQLRVDWDVADALAFCRGSADAFARGAGDVVDVERDDLADPGAGVERDERERLVARQRATAGLRAGSAAGRAGRAREVPWRRPRLARRSRARGRGACRSRRRRRARC
jgi:hypothetical protein